MSIFFSPVTYGHSKTTLILVVPEHVDYIVPAVVSISASLKVKKAHGTLVKDPHTKDYHRVIS